MIKQAWLEAVPAAFAALSGLVGSFVALEAELKATLETVAKLEARIQELSDRDASSLSESDIETLIDDRVDSILDMRLDDEIENRLSGRQVEVTLSGSVTL